MTTSIKVMSHNYPALVTIKDGEVTAHEQVLKPADGEVQFHCTTSRSVTVTDLEYDDPRVPADPPQEAPLAT